MKNVLIVDDSLELGRFLQSSLLVLEPTLKVAVVPSAEEAILESSRVPLDLLIADIRLPGISGIELVRKIRARCPVARVVMITGISDTRVDQQVKELVVDAFFRKPLDIPTFLETARRLLELAPEPAQPPAKPTAPLKKETRDERIEQEAKMAAELLEAMPEAPALKSLSDLLTDLRQQSGAAAALVIDESGRTIAQAGEPPDGGLMEKLASAWMAVHTPSLTLGALVEPGLPHMAQVVRGEQMDVLFAPLGMYSLGLFLRRAKSTLRLALALETVLESLDDLADVLGVDHLSPASALQPQLGLEQPQALPPAFVEEEAESAEPPSGEFLSALENKAVVDADSFWEDASTQVAVVSNPDMLTYDQALQLGLTPDDDEKGKA